MSAGEEEQGGWTVRGTLTAEQTDALEAFRARLFRKTAAGGKEGKHTTTKKEKEKEKAGDEEKAAAEERDEADAGELTDDQRRWLDDMCLCRYLRARDWDLDKAEEMIRATLAWRAEYRPELITAEDIEPEAEQGKMYFNGQHDKFGRPVIYMKPVRDTSNDRVIKLKYLVWILEQAIAAMDASKGVEKMVWVADFKGTGMRTSSVGNMQVSMDCMHVLLNHYPERLGVAFMTNTPWVFSAFWSVIKPFLNEVTLAKVQFINGKKDFAKILEVIEEEALEEDYGGKVVFEYDHETWKAQYLAKKKNKGEKEQQHEGDEDEDTATEDKSHDDTSEKKKKKKTKKKSKAKKEKKRAEQAQTAEEKSDH